MKKHAWREWGKGATAPKVVALEPRHGKEDIHVEECNGQNVCVIPQFLGQNPASAPGVTVLEYGVFGW